MPEPQELRQQVPPKLGWQALLGQGSLALALQERPQPELRVQPALGSQPQVLPRLAQLPLAG